jgi:hypothetical protein
VIKESKEIQGLLGDTGAKGDQGNPRNPGLLESRSWVIKEFKESGLLEIQELKVSRNSRNQVKAQ